MQCISPLKAGYTPSGELTYNNKITSKELVGIQFECRKCLPCRLNIAREKAIRCMHEAKMHQNNIFLTLTYSDEHLTSPRLIYKDWQDFAKRLRETTDNKITYMVTGEYGDKNKRPHWHAIIFNYMPEDAKENRITDRGDRILKSKTLDQIWGKNDPEDKPNEIGEVTLDSAGYVARYAAKKLIHGKDQDHDYHPLHKTSSKRAIGRSWIEKYYKHTFENGFVVLPNGQQAAIPRYYVDWCKKYQYDTYKFYLTHVQPELISKLQKQQRKEEIEYISDFISASSTAVLPKTRPQIKETILQSKFKQLQERLKL